VVIEFADEERAVAYVVSLAGEVRAHALGDLVSRDLVHGRRKVFGAMHNGSRLVFEGSAAPKRVPTGLKAAALSAAGNVVCIVSFGPAYQLQCLNQETLRRLWRGSAEGGRSVQRARAGAGNVYVLAQGRALAFNIADGKRLWATNEFRSGAFFKSFGRAALTRNENFELEWRDPLSGEVIADT
jgi:hypothetical protein